MRFGGLIFCGLGALSACATGGAVVDTVGVGPAPAGFTLDFARADLRAPRTAAEAAGDAAIPALVARRLAENGMVPSTVASSRYLVEVAYGGRPVTVGAYVETSAPAAEDRPNWLDKPERPGWGAARQSQICTLTVRFSEMATGKEVFRVRAADRGGKAGCAAIAPRLVDAALAKLPPSPARQAGRAASSS